MPATRRRAVATSVSGSVRITETASTPTATATTPTTTAQVRREPFTDQQLLAAWEEYIDKHPNEHVVISTMQLSKPVKVGDNHYSIAVDSVGQETFMNDNKAKWLNALRDSVKNDLLIIDITLSEAEPTHAILSPREIANDMAQRSPQFRQLVDDLGLQMA